MVLKIQHAERFDFKNTDDPELTPEGKQRAQILCMLWVTRDFCGVQPKSQTHGTNSRASDAIPEAATVELLRTGKSGSHA